MAAGFADIGRAWGSVHAVPGKAEADPRQADRVSWAGADAEFAGDVVYIGPDGRVEGVVGVGGATDDGGGTAGPFFLVAGDGAVDEANGFAGIVQQPDGLGFEIDTEAGRTRERGEVGDIGDDDVGADGELVEDDARVEG